MIRRSLLIAIWCAAAAPAAAAAPKTSSPAVAALQAARFDDAIALAQKDPSSTARAVAAIARYVKAAHQLASDLLTLLAGVEASRGAAVNWSFLQFALDHFEKELSAVDGELAAAARDPDVALELCLACWEVDWNRNGRVDRRDRLLFEVEVGADGAELPDGDPRRRPTFRFDVGDVWWARAMVAFQHAAVQLALAWRWSDLEPWLTGRGKQERRQLITLHLDDASRIARAKQLLLGGLGSAERARTEYLAERDDDREWVPNPRQKSHPLPLPVDDALYRTWGAIVGDLQRLVNGDEGLAFADFGKLAELPVTPRGFLNLGRLLSQPKDLSIAVGDLERLERLDAGADQVLKNIFGAAYASSMKPSPLPSRLRRMQGEIKRGEESFERKLRYLLWLN
jgi:hypothetical protein